MRCSSELIKHDDLMALKQFHFWCEMLFGRFSLAAAESATAISKKVPLWMLHCRHWTNAKVFTYACANEWTSSWRWAAQTTTFDIKNFRFSLLQAPTFREAMSLTRRWNLSIALKKYWAIVVQHSPFWDERWFRANLFFLNANAMAVIKEGGRRCWLWAW